jgi:hypothetical protein
MPALIDQPTIRREKLPEPLTGDLATRRASGLIFRGGRCQSLRAVGAPAAFRSLVNR